MATAKTTCSPVLGVDVIRAALVEAKLMTPKRARDAVYVATLAEELRGIEEQIAKLEEAMHLGSACAPELPPQKSPRPASDCDCNAEWIRTKSGELDLRLRRIEHSDDKL